jgi:alkylation response protein AidB-like acyl-CoA dehydrogenase
MNFHLSEEQQAMADSVGGAVDDVLSRERLLGFADGTADHDPLVWRAVMELGLASLAVPESSGGLGLGLLDLALMVEAVGQRASPGPIIQHLVATLAIAVSDNEGIKQKWLPSLLDGSVIATIAVEENWLPEHWTLAFEGGFVRGRPAPVPGGLSASLFVVGVAGGGLALVEGGERVARQALASTDRSRPVVDIAFEDAPASCLLVAGDPRVARLFDAALILTAADALGGAQYCLDLSVAYAKERQQFGQPIGRFQALKHQLAALAMEVEPARALLWYAAHAWDAELPDAGHAAAHAKAHVSDRFVTVSRAAAEAHGAIAYTWEYGLHIWLRRALFDQAYLGSPALHRARAAKMAGW